MVAATPNLRRLAALLGGLALTSLLGCAEPDDLAGTLVAPPFLSAARVVPSDGASGDSFGVALGLSGDTLVVGAPGANGAGGIDRGAAYVYQRGVGNTWGNEVKLTQPSPLDGDRFGSSVAIDGDYLVVGMPANGVVSRVGQVRVYHRQTPGTNTWDSGVSLTASGGALNNLFGWSVAISGDYIVVGAPQEDIAAVQKGAVYVFQRTGINTWDAGVQLSDAGGQCCDFFGGGVALNGDDLAVGIPNKSNLALGGSGYIWVYRQGIGNSWTFSIELTATDGRGAGYGNSISLDADTIAVGSSQSSSQTGRAYVYLRTAPDTWGDEFRHTPDDAVAPACYGRSVAVKGDLLFSGAPVCGQPGPERVYMHQRVAANDWSDGTLRTDPQPTSANDGYGATVAFDGSYLVVGVTSYQTDEINMGAALILSLTP